MEGFRYDDIMRWNAMKLFENPKTYLGMRVTDKVKALYQPEVFEGSTARDLIEYNGKTYIRMYSGKSLRIYYLSYCLLANRTFILQPYRIYRELHTS